MIKKCALLVICLVFLLGLFVPPALADQSIAYKHYFNEGVDAFKAHDDQKALRCFKIAQIYDPFDEELKWYMNTLNKRSVMPLQGASLPYEESVGFKYYFNQGVEVFKSHDNQRAKHDFNLAIIFDPTSKEVDAYLQQLANSSTDAASQIPTQVQVATVPVSSPEKTSGYVQEIASAKNQPRNDTVQVHSSSQAVSYISKQKALMPNGTIILSKMINNGQDKPKFQVELNSSILIEGVNIKRFLVVDEGFVVVKTVDANHLRVDAQRIGETFLHVWDDNGRSTLFLQVVFDQRNNPISVAVDTNVQHSRPFKITYANDWSTYYYGRNLPSMKRQSYDFNESLAIEGDTPYGYFDTSGSYSDFNAFTQFDTYTIGLSQVPLEGTSNFNLRGFDALRSLSPLTMPGTRLRGAFADVDLMEDYLGLSVSHGQSQAPLGFISMGGSSFNNSYIDAVKLTLFPKSCRDQYSFDFATGYGADRPSYLARHVYSVQGQHKFNDHLTLNAEEGSDTQHASTLASLKWENASVQTGLNFRAIGKEYSTVSTLPSNQGEIGAAWTADASFKKITASSFIEAYRDRINPNPNHPSALNYDANEHLRAGLTETSWSDTDLNFGDTQGQLSPRRSIGSNERISKSFGIWNALKGTLFGGFGYQNSHSSYSNTSDYDRENLITGVQLPLTSRISTFANYEYDWLHQPHMVGTSNPSVINAGLEYQKQFTAKFSIDSQLVYRDELGVTGTSSFLSGEKSVTISSGIVYNPTPDMSYFADGDVSKTFSHIGNPSNDDFEVRVGVRITFNSGLFWDPSGIVSGVVFIDKNQDGKYASGEAGVAGVKIKVGDDTAVTDQHGCYKIKVRAKSVWVDPVLDSVPPGLVFSTPQSMNVMITQGHKAQANFGLISQTGIYGIVFVDRNNSRVPNDGDKFIGKVKITLDGKITQKSDAHGAFYFRKVEPGLHSISIDINSLPLNMLPLIKLKNKIDVAEGTNYMFNIPVQIKKSEGGGG